MVEAIRNLTIDYKAACMLRLSPRETPPQIYAEFKAIEHAEMALTQDKWFEGQFGNHKVTLSDITQGVFTLEDFVNNVTGNCKGRNKQEHLRSWGERMIKMTGESSSGYDELNGHHQKVRDFVLRRPDIFGVELAVSTE